MKNQILTLVFIAGTILFGIGAESKSLVLTLIGLGLIISSLGVLVFNPKISFNS